MEGSVSNVDICNLAYTGQLEKVRQSVLSDKTLICKTDQVRIPALIRHIKIIVYLFTKLFISGPPHRPALGLFCWPHQHRGVFARHGSRSEFAR